MSGRFRYFPFIALVAGSHFLVGCAGSDLRREGGQLAIQSSDSSAAVSEIASFRDARALESDPSGRLYVVDAYDASVTILMPDGREVATFGGVGSGEYSLLEPSGVDPTNGLDFFVADTGNGRIQRFSTDGQLIESIPVPVGERASLRGESTATGRPVAVAIGPGGTMVAIEAERNAVMRWSANRRLTDIIGQDESEGQLRIPTDLAVTSEGLILVVDEGHNSVLIFSEFGRFVRTIPALEGERLVAVSVITSDNHEQLLLIHENSISIHAIGGGRLQVLLPDIQETLVDAAVSEENLLVITSQRLYRVH